MLRPHAARLRLTGTEPRTTLAALAALAAAHAPQYFTPHPTETPPATIEAALNRPGQNPGNDTPIPDDGLGL
jgi:hypothetical protein